MYLYTFIEYTNYFVSYHCFRVVLEPSITFLPIINYNFLYTRYKDLVKLTQKMHNASVTVNYSPISIGKLRLILHIEAAMHNFKQLGFTDKDIDEVKGIFADTNLYLLAGTVFISAMHVSLQ